MTDEEKRAKQAERAREYRARLSPEARAKILAYKSRYYFSHKERDADENRARRRAWYLVNKEKVKETQAKYYDEHREKIRAYYLGWRKNNPGIAAALRMNRKALMLMAMPKWVNRENIARLYAEAARKSLETGVPHVVDHIWPLQGKGFVGLHVPWNLRVIPWYENARKYNKRPDQIKEENHVDAFA